MTPPQQEVLRSKFTESEVLTIAHRLDTVIPSDLVVVIEQGHCEEADAPFLRLATSPTPQSLLPLFSPAW